MLVIHDVWPRYDAHQAARKTRKSWQNDRSILLRVMPRLPAVLADVRAVHVEDVLLEWAAAGKAPKTLNRAREVVHTFFAWLVRREELTRNPIDRVEKRAEPAPVITFLGTDEIAALLDLFAGSALLPVVSVLVFAGVRRSEACWLCPGPIAFPEASLFDHRRRTNHRTKRAHCPAASGTQPTRSGR